MATLGTLQVSKARAGQGLELPGLVEHVCPSQGVELGVHSGPIQPKPVCESLINCMFMAGKFPRNTVEALECRRECVGCKQQGLLWFFPSKSSG